MKKEYRIKKSQEFSKIIKQKKSFANKAFVIYYQPGAKDHVRIGLSVSKKLGKAVKRNLIKRQVRMMVNEIFDFEDPSDYIIIVRPFYTKQTFQDNQKLLAQLYTLIQTKKG